MTKIVKKRQLLNKRIVLNIVLVLFMFLTIGYSTLSTNLNINGNLNVKKYYEPTLYNVLAKEADTGGLAKKYTGEHHDSFTEEPSKDIYHWYANNNTEGTQVLDKNNVIFAGQCFQMIRTTDTGGVKMIYNGEADDGKCLNTRGTHVGYASRTSQNLSSNYWYGTDYTYDSTNKVFSISGATEEVTWNATTGPGLVGKYTCKQTTETGTCETLYLVESYNNTTNAFVLPLNSDSNYSQFGTLQFNASISSPSYVGYMYNTVYPYNSKNMAFTETVLSSQTISIGFVYSDEVVWNNPHPNNYNMLNTQNISSSLDFPNMANKYTFGGLGFVTDENNVSFKDSIYYVTTVDSSIMYYFELNNSGNHTLSDFNYTYTYGDSYTDNGNGTYAINNPVTINRSDWYTNYSSVKNKYVCKNAVNDTCSELWYTTSTTNTNMSYFKSSDVYKYSKGFTWNGSKYVLDNDTSVTFWNIGDSTNKTSLNNAHYTCWDTNGECTTISYIYYVNGNTPCYINISDGKNVEDALNEMLYNNAVNTKNSILKSGIDAWYKHYLLEDYDNYIEDIIYCNDRSQRNQSTNGWNPNGGEINSYLQFKEYSSKSILSCANSTDQFSVSNSSAKLTYKVGFMSAPDMDILNNNVIRNTEQNYWLSSPRYFNQNVSRNVSVNTDGTITGSLVNYAFGVRPAISLKPGTLYLSGDGSMANPYIVDTSNN